jgi:hypothetical protein
MSASSSASGSVRRERPEEPAAKQGGANYVVVHDTVGNVNLDWRKNRVVLADDYNDGDTEFHPERQLSEGALKRLVDLGAIRDATSDEVKAANEAKKAADEAQMPFTGYYIPEPPPETTVETSARSG